jgi:hypothetical protein
LLKLVKRHEQLMWARLFYAIAPDVSRTTYYLLFASYSQWPPGQ